jgi:hypothetical protein
MYLGIVQIKWRLLSCPIMHAQKNVGVHYWILSMRLALREGSHQKVLKFVLRVLINDETGYVHPLSSVIITSPAIPLQIVDLKNPMSIRLNALSTHSFVVLMHKETHPNPD